MIFSLFSDLASAKELYEDVRGIADDVKRGKGSADTRKIPGWVSALAALVIAVSVGFIIAEGLGDFGTARVSEPDAVGRAGAVPEPVPDCARDPFLDACK